MYNMNQMEKKDQSGQKSGWSFCFWTTIYQALQGDSGEAFLLGGSHEKESNQVAGILNANDSYSHW